MTKYMPVPLLPGPLTNLLPCPPYPYVSSPPSFPAHLLTTPYIPAFSLSLSTGLAWPRADRRRNQGGTASEGRRRGKRGNTIQPRGGGIINERTQWELRPDARSWANVLLLPLPSPPLPPLRTPCLRLLRDREGVQLAQVQEGGDDHASGGAATTHLCTGGRGSRGLGMNANYRRREAKTVPMVVWPWPI